MFGKTELTIFSYENHVAVDGPPTRRANVLDLLLQKSVDLDTLPVGTYTCKLVRKGLTIKLALTRLD